MRDGRHRSQHGRTRSFRHHTDACRLRFYLCWKEHNDPKYVKIRHLFEPDTDEPEPARIDLDDTLVRDAPGPVGNPPTPTGPPASAPAPSTPQFDLDVPRETPTHDAAEHVPPEHPEDESEVADFFMDTEDADVDENAMVDFLVLSGVDPLRQRTTCTQ